MIYKMTLKDSTDEMTFNLLEVPIVDKDIEGAVDNVTLDGNQYTDYLYLKKQYIQKWSIMCDEEYERLRGFYTRQFDEAEIPTYELYYGETIYNEYTRSGDYILVDVQGVEPARISLAQLDGNATQQTYSGKNLFDASTATLVNKYVNTNGAMTSASDWVGIESFFEVQPNTTYTFSAKNQGARFLWGEYATASGSDFISPRHESTGTFTTGSSTHYIRFSTNNANATDLQIELGSSATSYEPYVGGIPAPNPEFPQPISVVTGENVVEISDGQGDEQSYEVNLGSIELAKIGTHQDRIYKDEGKWYIEKQVGKVVLDGSETWAYNSSYGYNGFRYRNDDFNISSNNPSEDLICSHFTVATVRGASPTAPIIKTYAQNTDSMYIFLCDGTSDVDAFKQWLSTHPTTVYYALETPTTTEITNQTLIDQLEALINVSIATGIHNIFTEVASGNLNPTMIFNFIEVVSRRVELVPETPVRLTLADGGIINACGCRKDVQLTMRETIE